MEFRVRRIGEVLLFAVCFLLSSLLTFLCYFILNREFFCTWSIVTCIHIYLKATHNNTRLYKSSKVFIFKNLHTIVAKATLEDLCHWYMLYYPLVSGYVYIYVVEKNELRSLTRRRKNSDNGYAKNRSNRWRSIALFLIHDSITKY